MNSLFPLAGTIALLGSALIGGVFFAFSSFVMKALERVPSSEGIAAMQSINVVVINPSFLGAFMGTALLSLGVIALALARWSHPSTMFFLGGAIFYFAGTFLVTMVGNVPLNDQLAAVSATDPAAVELWEHYLARWTMWNYVRTAAAMVAALLYTLGLMQYGGT
ncbi:MAG: anthrone oxygenase family protein [Gammaproteobacteria bacterium]